MSKASGWLQASALAFTIYTLAKHPDKTEKLVKVRLQRWHSIRPHPALSLYLHCCTDLHVFAVQQGRSVLGSAMPG